jgi:hypothetical protein
MRRYFFNIIDGKTLLDDEGGEFADFDRVRAEAVRASSEMLRGLDDESLRACEPWKMWVTDQPKGAGNTVHTHIQRQHASPLRGPNRWPFSDKLNGNWPV